MKKLALALVCLVSVAFFASCNPDVENPQPSIAVYAEEGYVTDGATVELTDVVNFGFVLASNSETNKELKSLVVTIDDVEWYNNQELTGTSFTYTDSFSFDAKEIIGQVVINAVVTDAAGETATATINVNVNYEDEPLFVTPINWVRRGANVTEGADQLAALGLTWSSSYKEVFATFKPAEGYSLYKFDGINWDEISTQTAKEILFAAAMETLQPMESFREITTAHSSDYDAVIGTVKGDEMHLMHITHCTIETGSYGTQLTITGEAK